ncbi:hypothetical protein D9756_000549 [Leucocoprinus leucothites]|uniref:Major facilitator superfamily (MFS) profile domain-containing protein n=1 Tax=Leucocoprinus leucothites TaxID=201217 RepID=A0A8H5GES1_9AGAR|nr:hypothetical protein D9756_000549 [Leucoagaricus leucothites]
MSTSRRASVSETTSLLEESPPSYHTANDVDEAIPEPEADSDPQPLNQFSRRDICWILAGLWSAVLLGAFDGTVVATLLTPIGSEFNASNQSSYIATSYLLSVCCFTPLYGRLADILGRKGAMLLALTLFGSGTILCGMAPSMSFLIISRAIAGMGGGGYFSRTADDDRLTDMQLSLKHYGFRLHPAETALFGLGAGLGGPLGGWAPILAFSFILVIVKVNIRLPSEIQNQPLSEKLRRVDVLGSITLVMAVGFLLLGFSLKTTEELAWSHPLIASLLSSSVVFGFVFVYVEKHWAPYPVMPLRLMTQRTPLAVSISNLLTSMTAFSMLYNVPLVSRLCWISWTPPNIGSQVFLRGQTRASRESWSSSFTPLGKFPSWSIYIDTVTIESPKGCNFHRKRLRRVDHEAHRKTLHANSGFITTDYLREHSCFGMASFITSTLIAMIAGVYREDMAVATGITYLFRTTGQVLGVSLSGAVLQGVLLQRLRARITGPGADKIIYLIQHTTDIIPTLDPVTRQAAVDSYADALRVVFICQVAINVCGLLACLPIQENALPSTPQSQVRHSTENEES